MDRRALLAVALAAALAGVRCTSTKLGGGEQPGGPGGSEGVAGQGGGGTGAGGDGGTGSGGSGAGGDGGTGAGGDGAGGGQGGAGGCADGCTGPVPVLNEVVAADAAGGPDWIELFNGTGAPIALAGFELRDAGDNSFTFPEGSSIADGEHLVLTGELSFTFGLGGDDALTLLDPAGAVADSTDWPDGGAASGTSWGRYPDGTGPFRPLPFVTPGAPNSLCGDGVIEPPELCEGADLGGASCLSRGFLTGVLRCGAGCEAFDVTSCYDVVLNEVDSDPDDFVELRNAGASAQDLSGWYFTDDAGGTPPGDGTRPYLFAAGTSLAAGGFLVRTEADDFAFGLGGADSLSLHDADGDLVDGFAWTEHAGGSYARCPDGVGQLVDVDPEGGTPGESNEPSCP